MAKRSRKRHVRPENDNAGCMWGFISLFDFRQVPSSRMLLSDRKHGSSRHAGTGLSRNKFMPLRDLDDNVDEIGESGSGRVDPSMASVKSLMEKEMSKPHSSQNNPGNEVEQERTKLGFHTEKSHKKLGKKSKAAVDLLVNELRVATNLDSDQSHCPNPLEISVSDFDLAALMDNLYGSNRQTPENHLNCKTMLDSSSLLENDSELAEKLSVIQRALSDVANTFLSQKLSGGKHVSDEKAVYESKQFLNALETLSANKELFLKLIQDRNTVLLKHIEDLQNAQAGLLSEFDLGKCIERSKTAEVIGGSVNPEEASKTKLLEKRNLNGFWGKKEKSKGAKPSKENNGNQPSNRIVVLKPNPPRSPDSSVAKASSSSPGSFCSSKHQEVSEKVGSYFSLKEIKRKLKNAIGDGKKERHLISMDGVLHKIPYGYKDLGNIRQKSIEKAVPGKSFSNTKHPSSQSNAAAMKKENLKRIVDNTGMSTTTTAPLVHTESAIYEEARKHLVEMLNTKSNTGILHFGPSLKSLGGLLSLPEYNMLSPRLSPGRDKETETSPSKQQTMQENAVNNISLDKAMERSSFSVTYPDFEEQVTETRPTTPDTDKQEAVCVEENLGPGGNMETVQRISMEECTQESNHLCELPESNDTEEVSIIPALGSSEEIPPEACRSTPSMPSSLHMQNVEAPDEHMFEKPKRPSPVSVLEPFFSEDSVSPQRTSAEHGTNEESSPANFPVQPRQLHFEEHENSAIVLISQNCGANPGTCLDDKEVRDEFVSTVLETSGLTSDESLERWHSSDQLLDPSVLDEVGIAFWQVVDDPQLLFDCVDEVLGEIRWRHFSCTPWMLFVRPNVRPIPKGTDLIREVCRGVDWHFKVQFPTTLDQLVGKDMEGGSWMDLRVENEDAIIDVGDDILEYLMEETILELWCKLSLLNNSFY